VSHDHRVLVARIKLTMQGNPCCSLGKVSRELHVSRRTIQNAVNEILAGNSGTCERNSYL
jgi:hypothetical protein